MITVAICLLCLTITLSMLILINLGFKILKELDDLMELIKRKGDE